MAQKIIDLNALSHFLADLKLYLPTVYAELGDLPTRVSDLTNDSNYQNATQVQTLIDSAIAGITGIEFVVVQSLPATGETGKIYLVSNSGAGQNIYDEYVWLTGTPGRYEKIGTTDIDLSNYVTYNSTTDEFSKSGSVIAQYATNAEVDALFS